jgi:hypothetical protein
LATGTVARPLFGAATRQAAMSATSASRQRCCPAASVATATKAWEVGGAGLASAASSLNWPSAAPCGGTIGSKAHATGAAATATGAASGSAAAGSARCTTGGSGAPGLAV